jgi:hypothetical protein
MPEGDPSFDPGADIIPKLVSMVRAPKEMDFSIFGIGSRDG